MKRFVACVLLFLLLSFGVSAAEQDGKRFYLEVTRGETEDSFLVNICMEGLTLQDDLSTIHVSLSYPEDQLVCKDWSIGAALRAFSIKQGPQYTTSNPAIFLGVEVGRPVTAEGVIAAFEFEAVEGAEGEAELVLELIEAVHLSSDASFKDEFAVEGATLKLSGAELYEAPACRTDATLHEGLAWTTDALQEGRLVKRCALCGKVLEERVAEKVSSDPVTQGDTVFAPMTEKLPADTTLSVTEEKEEPREDLLARVYEKLGTDRAAYVGAYHLSLMLSGEAFSTQEAGKVSVSAPDGVRDGDTLYAVCVLPDGTVSDAQTAVVSDGRLTLASKADGTLYLFLAEAEEEEPEVSPQAPSEGEDAQDPQTPSESDGDGETTPSPVGLWIGLLALVLCGVGAGIFVFVKKKR